MKNVTILIPEGAVMSSIAESRHMFVAANELLKSSGKNPIFKVQLAGLTKEVKLNDGVFTINPDLLLQDVPRTDLVIIPALSGDLKEAVEINKNFVPWIVEQYKNGSEIASLCVGAFLLASTGLLKGKHCSTHWLHANLFRSMFPDVVLVDDRIVTEENGLYTSGGASLLCNLLLYLV